MMETEVNIVKRTGTTKGKESSDLAPCACADGSSSGRKAVAVDPEIKRSNLNRLRRIEGQVRGLQKMVDEERYCADIVVQIASVQEALRGVSRALMQNHLRHCATEAIRSGSEGQAAAQYDELLELIYKHLR
ncbi:MAG TPA: metal-sensitive transcriptional regulator [Bryobacteraceae bacterium]|nr:metal-sensitive transcriptional regulator [Bryobacteraceae bacterium]